MGIDEKYGPRRQITFRLGPLAMERLQQIAELFHMKSSEYAKALIYRELQVFNESPDMRRRSKRRKARKDRFSTSEL